MFTHVQFLLVFHVFYTKTDEHFLQLLIYNRFRRHDCYVSMFSLDGGIGLNKVIYVDISVRTSAQDNRAL